MEAIINFATSQWEGVVISSTPTYEQCFRALLKMKLQHLKTHKSMIHQSDHFLLAKTDSLFEQCGKANLEMWYIHVKLAVERQEQNMKNTMGDIRKYGQVTKRKSRTKLLQQATHDF